MSYVNSLKLAHTRTQAKTMELEVMKAQDEYEAEMLREPDPMKWIPNHDKRMAEIKKQFIPENASPDEQEQLVSRFDFLNDRGRGQVAKQTALAVLQNDKTATSNLLQRAELKDDEALRQQTLSDLSKVGYSPAEIEKVRMESDRRVGNSRIERQINENPLEWNQKLKSADSIKGFPGLGDRKSTRLNSSH